MWIAGYKDIPALSRIWAQCFEEDKKYLSLFFLQGFPLGKTLVAEQEGRAASILTLLPCTCRVEDDQYPAAYIYGVATAPEFRGRGLSTALLEQADEYLKKQGTAMAFLAPASPELFEFYRKRGFCTQFYLQKKQCPPAIQGSMVRLRPVAGQEYGQIRFQFLPQNAVVWSEGFLQYAAQEAAFYRGGLYAVEAEGETVGCCGVYPTEQKTVIKELLTLPQWEEQAIGAVQAMHTRGQTEVHLPWGGAEKGAPFAMAKWYNYGKNMGKKAYTSLVLD